jgi:microsomal dipeptidase-like Zn-dependent dipeptidase
VIADLHCHYPMHLLPRDHHPHGVAGGWLRKLKDEFDAEAVVTAADLLNDPRWCGGWRVDLDGLVQGEARIVCSVLYWPAGEFRFGTRPASGSFADLQSLLSFVEDDLHKRDPNCERHLLVKQTSDLTDDSRVAFVHCVEGGFHLGPNENEIDAHVQWLAENGVLYITLAHLFYLGVATNAPAIPPLTDAEYDHLFPQPAGVGLTDLGKAAVRSMYRHKVLVDISHMSEDAVDETFALIEQLDQETGSDPRDFPVLATHVGMRSANPASQLYNLTPETATRIQARGGLIGLILAQHQVGSTQSAADSTATLRRHINAIGELGNGLQCCAFGTDLDGFIKPTLTGIERASDLSTLAQWIQQDFPADADGIVYDNARAVLHRVLAARGSPARNA